MGDQVAYEARVSVTMRVYLDEESLYDNHTKDKVLDMLASDIKDGWITRSEADIRIKPIREIPWEDIDSHNPWEAAREDAAIG